MVRGFLVRRTWGKPFRGGSVSLFISISRSHNNSREKLSRFLLNFVQGCKPGFVTPGDVYGSNGPKSVQWIVTI